MPSTSISVPNQLGHELAARLDEPEGQPLAFAVFAHCFTCSKETVAAARVSRGLAKRGIGVLRLDFTGLGESGGEFAESTFSGSLD
ncbi:MAG: osmotically inducible protein C, partial [Phycisphaerales bacterium]|nr:osmotically inducible protein C [Phycisphaerales bacterium]